MVTFGFLLSILREAVESFLAERRAYKRAECRLKGTPVLTKKPGEKFSSFWFRRQVAIKIAMSKDNELSEKRRAKLLGEALDIWCQHRFDPGLFWNYPRNSTFLRAIRLREAWLCNAHEEGRALVSYARNEQKFLGK